MGVVRAAAGGPTDVCDAASFGLPRHLPASNNGRDAAIILFLRNPSMSVALKAKAIYEDGMRAELEANHFGDFVAIEPLSRDTYVAKSFIDAALAAKRAHPDRKSFVLRIGHEAAVHLGAVTR